MKFKLAKEEIQTLLAKALGVKPDEVKVTAKDLEVDLTCDISKLMFADAPKQSPKPELKVESPTTEEPVAADEPKEDSDIDDDGIDFL